MGGLRWGVEPICAVLTERGIKIAPSTYYEHLNRAPVAREQRDELLKIEIARVHKENFAVYRAHRAQAVRKGFLAPSTTTVIVSIA